MSNGTFQNCIFLKTVAISVNFTSGLCNSYKMQCKQGEKSVVYQPVSS